MAIKYYPNRSQSGSIHPIAQQMRRDTRYVASGGGDITSVTLDDTVSPERDWTVQSILFNFSDTTARDVTVTAQQGRRIVESLNDYLWFHVQGTNPQRIVLSPGFYTGDELAAHLQTKLDANTAYAAKSITFTVVYDNGAGTFDVSPSSGTIKYLNVNTQQTIQIKDSIAGHLFGLNETDTVFLANVVSDTPVRGLNDSTGLITLTASALLTYYDDTAKALSIDQALNINTNAAAIDATYNIVYTLNY